MTMPSKIYVAPGSGFEGNDILIADESDWSGDGVKFVRADIAESLARALQKCRDELISVYHSEFDGVWSKSDFYDVAEYYDTVLCHYYNETTH